MAVNFSLEAATPNAEPDITWVKKVEAQTFEAENVLVNKDVIGSTPGGGRWAFFVQDGNRWSGDKTLQGEKIFADRSPAAPESATLKFRIPLKKGEKYNIIINGGRTYGISLDGQEFKKGSGRGYRFLSGYVAESDSVEFYVANCYVDPIPGFTYVDSFVVEKVPVGPEPKPKPVFNGFAKTRVSEKFSRGTVSIPMAKGGVYVSWRLLKDDPKNIKFDILRVRDGVERKLNQEPIELTCDFVDAEGKKGDVYRVRPTAGSRGQSGEASTARWMWDEKGMPHINIKLSDPKATVQKVAVADIDGDGVYDYVVKTPNKDLQPMRSFGWKPSPETYKLSAYLADGTHLWTKDLGWGIELGIWYSPFIAYDFNGDGKAEIAVKMGEGDPRDKEGFVLDGLENLVVLDGMTGRELARAPWPSREGFENYNMVSRNQLSLAYLDGKTPCVIALRGTYGTMKAEAWQFKGDKLESCWKFTNHEGPYDEGNKENCWKVKTESSPKYYGQGAHQSIVADLDGDGRDEVVLGSFVLNGNGDPVWALKKGHPDWMILSDIVWENPGMEIAYMYESSQSKGGVCVVDAKTGKILWESTLPSKHIHAGHCVNFDPTLSGPEVLGVDHDVHAPIEGCYWRFTNTGKLLSNTSKDSGPALKGVYWDADLEKEVVAGGTIRDYRGGNIGKISGAIAWCPFVADLFGDWREEIVTSVPGELRIYSTTIPAMDRRVCLMQEHSYRTKVAINSQAYYYDPDLPYTPTFESNNFSLIFKRDTGWSAEEGLCQVVVSASKIAPFSGTVTLHPTAGIIADQTTWKFSLKPGEIETRNVRISGKLSAGTTFKGEIKESGSGRIYRAQVFMYADIPKFKPPSGNHVIKIPAGSFSESIGGKALVVMGRPLASDGCLIGWDNIGHKITWTFPVAKAGSYRMIVQYASAVDSRRNLVVNGKTAGNYPFISTGGKGESVDEWNQVTLAQNNNSTLINLDAGDNKISLENMDGNMLNLAYIYLELVE